nr:metalloregulator ArsR/SmtB family transcription factor [Amycolatopsis rubida]
MNPSASAAGGSGPKEAPVSRPLYQLKAEFFKTLGHPARIRVLELLSQREHAVAEMLPEVGIEPANLSQQLAVLRRMGLVTTRKEGSSVYYSLISPQVAELMAVAREILTGVLSGQVELLDDLRTAQAGSAPSAER